MTEKDYQQTMEALKEQRKRIANEPGYARELLDSLGISQFMVPKGTQIRVEYPVDVKSEAVYLETMLYVFLCN